MTRQIRISFINCIVDKTMFNGMVNAPKKEDLKDFTAQDHNAWWINASLLHFKTYYELYSPDYAKNVHWHQVLPVVDDYENDYVNQVIENQANWLFIGLYTWTHPGIDLIVKRIKEKLPNIKVMVGGPEVEHKDLNWIKERDWIDYACYGDGYNLVKYLLDSDFNLRRPRIEETENALWVENGQVVKAEHKIFRDKKFFSIPVWWHNREIVREWLEYADKNNITVVINLETNRGCPYHCAFCDWTSGLHNKVTFWQLMPLYKDLAFLGQEGCNYVKICDANYGQVPRDMDIAKFWALVRRKYGTVLTPVEITWAKLQKERVYEIFNFMLEEGFTDGPDNANILTWTLSFQDVHTDVLSAIDRPEIPWKEHKEYMRKMMEKFPDAQFIGELISGMPNQTPESMVDAMSEILSLPSIRPRWYLWVYLPNSPVGTREYRDKIGVKVLTLNAPKKMLFRPPTKNDISSYSICISYNGGLQNTIDNFKMTCLLKNFYTGYHSKLLTMKVNGEYVDNFIDKALWWFEQPGNNEIWQLIAKKCEDIITGRTRDAYFYTSVYTVDLWGFINNSMHVDVEWIPENGYYPDATYEQKKAKLLEYVLQPVTLDQSAELEVA